MKHLHMLWLPRVLTTPVAHVLFIFLVQTHEDGWDT